MKTSANPMTTNRELYSSIKSLLNQNSDVQHSTKQIERKVKKLLSGYSKLRDSRERESQIALHICYHNCVFATVADTQCVFATVADTQCVFATVANTHSEYLLLQMRIFTKGNIKGQFFYNRNEYSASAGHTRNGILLLISSISFTELCRS